MYISHKNRSDLKFLFSQMTIIVLSLAVLNILPLGISCLDYYLIGLLCALLLHYMHYKKIRSLSFCFSWVYICVKMYVYVFAILMVLYEIITERK